ncbi:MAG: hypothetical protein Q7K03_08325 [Dehalococcoidia bacterium]|nr:hypothetical protein [Dehalococcoidia bacterium]
MTVSSFSDNYAALEGYFREQAKQDGDCSIFLPNVSPSGPVDFIFIGMEPSLRSWARSLKDAQDQIDAGFRDFLFSLEDFILHFCIRRFLCEKGQTYHLTNIGKAAMTVGHASQDREARWHRWYPLLQEEIDLVRKPNVKIFAIGTEVSRFLKKNSFAPQWATLLHHSKQASKYRMKTILGREHQFKDFAATISLDGVVEVAKEVMVEAKMPDLMFKRNLSRIRQSCLTTSRKALIWAYKEEFKKSR